MRSPRRRQRNRSWVDGRLRAGHHGSMVRFDPARITVTVTWSRGSRHRCTRQCPAARSNRGTRASGVVAGNSTCTCNARTRLGRPASNRRRRATRSRCGTSRRRAASAPCPGLDRVVARLFGSSFVAGESRLVSGQHESDAGGADQLRVRQVDRDLDGRATDEALPGRPRSRPSCAGALRCPVRARGNVTVSRGKTSAPSAARAARVRPR